MASQSLIDDLRGFFDGYAAAFNAGDGPRAAGFYHAPCLKTHGNGSIYVLRTPDDVLRFVQGVADGHHARGARGSRFTDFQVTPIAGRSALVTIAWELLGEDGSVLRRWRRSYTLARVGDDWKILVQLSHLD